METNPSSPRPKATLFSFGFFLIIGFVLLGLFWVFTKYVHLREGEYTDEEAERSVQRVEIREKILKEADAELNRYAWRDKEKGLVQLPVERGMQLALVQLNQNREVRPTTLVDPAAAAKELEAAQNPAPAPEPVPQPPASPEVPAPEPPVPTQP